MTLTSRSFTAILLVGGLYLGGLPALAQPHAVPTPLPPGHPDAVSVPTSDEEPIDPLLEPEFAVSFVAREPFVGKRRIKFLIDNPKGAGQELTDTIILNSSGLTTKDVRRIRRGLTSSIRAQASILRKWYQNPKVKGVFAHLVYSDHTPIRSTSVTFSTIT